MLLIIIAIYLDLDVDEPAPTVPSLRAARFLSASERQSTVHVSSRLERSSVFRSSSTSIVCSSPITGLAERPTSSYDINVIIELERT